MSGVRAKRALAPHVIGRTLEEWRKIADWSVTANDWGAACQALSAINELTKGDVQCTSASQFK